MKPIVIVKRTTGSRPQWFVKTRSVAILDEFGAKNASKYADQVVVKKAPEEPAEGKKKGRKKAEATLDFAPVGSGEPALFTRDYAETIAHQLGRYKLGFGDLMYAYTDYEDEQPSPATSGATTARGWFPSETTWQAAEAKPHTSGPFHRRNSVPFSMIDRGQAGLTRMEQIPAIADAIAKGGEKVPPVWLVENKVTGRFEVVDGRHRLEAARLAGAATVPAFIVGPGGEGMRPGYAIAASAPQVMASSAAPTSGAALFAVNENGLRMPVSSAEDAARKWNAFRDASGAGVSDIGNGVRVETSDGKVVARISYNGRIHPAGQEPGAARDQGEAVRVMQRADARWIITGPSVPEHLTQEEHYSSGTREIRQKTWGSMGEALKAAQGAGLRTETMTTPPRYRVEIMNKIEKGRAVGNDWIVVDVGADHLHHVILGHYGDDEAAARAEVAGLIAGKPHNSPTVPAKDFISRKIELLRAEGKPQKQAVAIAFDMARRAGYRSVPEKGKKS